MFEQKTERYVVTISGVSDLGDAALVSEPTLRRIILDEIRALDFAWSVHVDRLPD
jgi:hypothetical protein